MSGQFAAREGGRVEASSFLGKNNSTHHVLAYWVGDVIKLGNKHYKEHKPHHPPVDDPYGKPGGHSKDPVPVVNPYGKPGGHSKDPVPVVPNRSNSSLYTSRTNKPEREAQAIFPNYGKNYYGHQHEGYATGHHGAPQHNAYSQEHGYYDAKQSFSPGFVTANPMVDFDDDGIYENLGPIENTSYYQTLHDQTSTYFHDQLAFYYDEINRDYRDTLQNYQTESISSWFNYNRSRQNKEMFWTTLEGFTPMIGAGIDRLIQESFEV